MKKVTLFSALCFVALLALPLAQSSAQTGIYKYHKAVGQKVNPGQSITTQINVPDDVDIADVRVGVFAKTVMYSSIRIELMSPEGTLVVLKGAQPANTAPWYGPLGHKDSYTLFRDGGNSFTANSAPNDNVFAPAGFLSTISGESGKGVWTLTLIDEGNFSAGREQQDGMFYEWILMFNEVIQEPELVLFEQTLVGSSLVPIINGRGPDGAVIPNNYGVGTGPCDDNIFELGTEGDAFAFVINGVPGNIGDPVPPLVSAGRFEIVANIATNYPNGPLTSALTEDIAMFFGQAEENWASTLPTPPATYPNPTVTADWPTGPATTVGSLYPGPEGFQGGVRLIACNPSFPSGGDFGGFSPVTFSDAALEDITSAQSCGGIPGAGVCGTYRPETGLSTLAGSPRAVNGLYYVTIYDTFGETAGELTVGNDVKFGQIRVLSLTLRYVAGGGNTPDPNLHHGIVSPLMGVPIPGPVDGAVLGYLTSTGNTIPPYTYHAVKDVNNFFDREPILYFWPVQKQYPRAAVGYEALELINANNNQWGQLEQWGPFAYPSALDDNSLNPSQAGTTVNASALILNDGNWKIRNKLVQPRYDRMNSDNESVSPPFMVTPNKFAYYGDPVFSTNKYNNPTRPGFDAPRIIGGGQGIGHAFTLFQFPNTHISSVDYLLHNYQLGTTTTPQAAWRITIWDVDNGFTGEPDQMVAQSPVIDDDEYIPGNWRSATIYDLDANGRIDLNNPGVDLPPGTYVVMLDVQGNQNIALVPHEYGMAPDVADFFRDFQFSDNFGPIGLTSDFETILHYLSTDLTVAPDFSWGQSNSTVFANFALPMGLNMEYKNDFSVDYVEFSGTLGNETVSLPNAPFTPVVNVSSRTGQGGVQKSCNVQLKIYQGSSWGPGDYISDKLVNLNGYSTVPVTCDNWTPSQGGTYKVDVYFSRNPDDNNDVNDMLSTEIFVSSTGAIIAVGDNADEQVIAKAQSILEGKGHEVQIQRLSEGLNAVNSQIYVIGDVNDVAQLETSLNAGNQIAFINAKNDAFGSKISKIDRTFGIERHEAYDPANVKLGVEVRVADATPRNDINPVDIKINSKQDLLNYMNSDEYSARDREMFRPSDAAIQASIEDAKNVLTDVKNSPLGDITLFEEDHGDIEIVYAAVKAQKSGPVVTAAPASVSLQQNYPNPFNPSTSISYTLTDESTVTLRVLDMLGREVSTLVNETQAAGSYSVVWEGTDASGQILPSGTYLYRLDAVPANGGDAFTSTKKMTLSK